MTIQVGTTNYHRQSVRGGGFGYLGWQITKGHTNKNKKAVDYTNSPLKKGQLSAKRYLEYLLAQHEVWTQPRPIYRPRVERLVYQVQSVEEAHQVGGGES